MASEYKVTNPGRWKFKMDIKYIPLTILFSTRALSKRLFFLFFISLFSLPWFSKSYPSQVLTLLQAKVFLDLYLISDCATERCFFDEVVISRWQQVSRERTISRSSKKLVGTSSLAMSIVNTRPFALFIKLRNRCECLMYQKQPSRGVLRKRCSENMQ